MSGLLPAGFLALLLGPAGGPGPVRAAGSPPPPARVAGTVRAKPKTGARTGRSGAYGDRELRHARLFDYRRLTRVVVHARPLDREAAAAAPPAALALRIVTRRYRTRIEPEFSVLAAGAGLELENRAGGTRRIFSDGMSPESFALELGAGGTERVVLRTPGFYQFYPDEEGGSPAGVLAAGPYFDQAGAGGGYALALPPGRYEITAWHPRLPPASRELRVEPGERLRVDFVLSVESLPEVAGQEAAP